PGLLGVRPDRQSHDAESCTGGRDVAPRAAGSPAYRSHMGLPSPAPDRTALVTGASSGIGEELARQLAAKGHGVTLVARREDRLTRLAAGLRSNGVRAEVLAADLGDRAARAELPDRVAELGLSVEILANNAGFSTTGPVASADVEAELRMIEVDV